MRWQTVPLGEVAEQIRGVTYSKGEAIDTPTSGYVALVRAGNIGEAGLHMDDLIHVPATRVSPRQWLRVDDVVVASSSGSLSVVGKAARVVGSIDATFGAFCKVLRPFSGIDAGYFAHYFRTAEYRRYISSVAAGANINNLRNEDLDRIEIPLPPLPEQRRIAAILDEADAVRVLAGAQESKLRELLDSFFDSVAGAPGRRSVTVGDLVESSQYGTSAKAGESGQFPILRMGNVTNDGRIDLTNMKFIDIDESDHARYLVHRGDLLFNRTNSADLVGKTAVYREAEPRAFAGYLVRLRPKSLELGEYVAGYLNSRHGKLTLRKMAKSIVGMANINAREALSIRLPEPDSATLTSLLDLRQRVEAERERLGTRRRWTDELFASLQHRAFRGEL